MWKTCSMERWFKNNANRDSNWEMKYMSMITVVEIDCSIIILIECNQCEFDKVQLRVMPISKAKYYLIIQIFLEIHLIINKVDLCRLAFCQVIFCIKMQVNMNGHVWYMFQLAWYGMSLLEEIIISGWTLVLLGENLSSVLLFSPWSAPEF